MGAGLNRLLRELVWVQKTERRWVAMLRDVYDEYEKIDKRWKAKLERHFRNYGQENLRLPPEHFKSEGRFSSGGRQSKAVQVFVFKAFQHRLYGVCTSIDSVPTFVGLKLVTDKKRDTADQTVLQGVARSFQQYMD